MKRVVEDLIDIALEKKINALRFINAVYTTNLNTEDLDQQRIEAKRFQLELERQEAEKKTVYYHIDQFIQSKTKKVSADTLRIYRNMKNHLHCFEVFTGRPLTFEQMDLTFYEEFVEFLSYEYVQGQRKTVIGLKVNTIGKTIKELRVFCRIECAKSSFRQSIWRAGQSLRRKPMLYT